MAGVLHFPITLSDTRRFQINITPSAVLPIQHHIILHGVKQARMVLRAEQNPLLQIRAFRLIITDTNTHRIVVTSYPFATSAALRGGLAIGIIRAKDIAILYKFLSGDEISVDIGSAVDVLQKCIAISGLNIEAVVSASLDEESLHLSKDIVSDPNHIYLDAEVSNIFYVKPALCDGGIMLSCEAEDISANITLRDIVSALSLSANMDYFPQLEKHAEISYAVNMGSEFDHFGVLYADCDSLNGFTIFLEGEAGVYRWRLLYDLDDKYVSEIDSMDLGEIDMYLA